MAVVSLVGETAEMPPVAGDTAHAKLYGEVPPEGIAYAESVPPVQSVVPKWAAATDGDGLMVNAGVFTAKTQPAPSVTVSVYEPVVGELIEPVETVAPL